MSVQLSYQNLSSQVAVFITGDTHEETEQTFFSYWNWGATGGEPEWFNDLTLRFWTTWPKLKAAVAKIAENKVRNEVYGPNEQESKRYGKKLVAKLRAKTVIETKRILDSMMNQAGYLNFGLLNSEYHMASTPKSSEPEDWKEHLTNVVSRV